MQAPCWNVWKQSQLNFRATVPTGCTSSSLALWLSLRKWAAMLETRRLSTRSEIFYFGKIFHRLILRLNKASTLVSWHLWTMPPGCQLCFFLLLSKPDPGLQLLLPKTTWEWHVSSISFVFIFLIPSLDFVLVVYLEICFRNMPIFYKNKFDNLTEINIDKKEVLPTFPNAVPLQSSTQWHLNACWVHAWTLWRGTRRSTRSNWSECSAQR